MKRDVVRFLGVLLLILVFSLLVYPTPFKYIERGFGSGLDATLKINRFTGTTYIFEYNDGWIKQPSGN